MATGSNKNGEPARAKKATADESKTVGRTPDAATGQLPPDVAKRIAELRSAVQETFGKVVLALMMTSRYRSQSLADLNHLVLEPLLRDRIAIAHMGKAGQAEAPTTAGFAIWASVSEEVDGRIREQIKAGAFPIRLKSEDWNSGKINWLFDVIAPDSKTIASVIANFRKVATEGELRLHPLVARLLDPETLEKLGARHSPSPAGDAPKEPAAGAQ